MKKIIIVSVILVICLGTAQAQQKVDPSAAATLSFEQKFGGATDVHWSKKNEVLGVSFTHEKTFSIAYFNEQGDLLARGRGIPEVQLPLLVQEEVDRIKNRSERKYGALAIASIYEFSRSGETEYILTMENEKVSLLLVSDGNQMRVRRKS